MEQTRKINLNHFLLHILFQAVAAVVYGFGIYLLTSRGYNSAEAGLVMCFGNLLSACIQPVVSNFLDNSKKVNLFQMILIVTSLVSMLFLFNVLITSRVIILPIILVLAFGLYSSLEPLVNSISHTFSSNNIKVDFTPARACGSASYGIFCLILGKLSVLNSRSVSFVGFILACILALICGLLNDNFNKTGIVLNNDKKEDVVSFKDFIKNHKRFILLCVFLTGILCGYTSMDNFSLYVVERVGGNSDNMGTLLCIKAILEMFGMYLFAKLIKKYSIESILSFMAICFVLKGAATYLASSVFALYLSQFLQILSFAFVIPGMVQYVNLNMKANETIRGQALFTLTITIGSTLSSLLGGMIINNLGTCMMEIIATTIEAICAVGYIIMLRKKD